MCQAQSSGTDSSHNFQLSEVSTQTCLCLKCPSLKCTSLIAPFHHSIMTWWKHIWNTSAAFCPLQEGPSISLEQHQGECQGELLHICSMLCSGQPSPQSFSRRGCSSGLIFKESGPSHPCCSFNDVNELQQGWNWAIIFYVHMSCAY